MSLDTLQSNPNDSPIPSKGILQQPPMHLHKGLQRFPRHESSEISHDLPSKRTIRRQDSRLSSPNERLNPASCCMPASRSTSTNDCQAIPLFDASSYDVSKLHLTAMAAVAALNNRGRSRQKQQSLGRRRVSAQVEPELSSGSLCQPNGQRQGRLPCEGIPVAVAVAMILDHLHPCSGHDDRVIIEDT